MRDKAVQGSDSRFRRSSPPGLIPWALLAGILAGTCCAAYQSTGFEVVSIRPSAALSDFEMRAQDLFHERNGFGNVSGRGRAVELKYITLQQLVAIAYRVRTPQVIGPKGGLGSERFDIKALLPEGESRKLATEMLKGMLKDRFALRIHTETRDERGLLLVVRADGPRLKVADPARKRSGSDIDAQLSAKREVLPRGVASRFWSPNCTMAALIDYLSGRLQVPIADRTGLAGMYDLVLDIAPPEDSDGFDLQARIIEAVRRLGLDLKTGEVPVDVMVVDSISKVPTAN